MLGLFVAQQGVGASWRCDYNLAGVKLTTKRKVLLYAEPESWEASHPLSFPRQAPLPGCLQQARSFRLTSIMALRVPGLCLPDLKSATPGGQAKQR